MKEQILSLLNSSHSLSMAAIQEAIPGSQKEVLSLVKSGVLEKFAYCFGSGGFDGLGFRTRPWNWHYKIKSIEP